jgi:parallel beta-helix repeat protein
VLLLATNPSGGRRRGRRLTPLERRMVNPIVRDIDVVSQPNTSPEPGTLAQTGQPVSNAVVVDANDDLVAEVAAAGASSLVMVDGSAGPLNISNTAVMHEGQTLAGGGSQLTVVGANTGTTVRFTAPGTRPTVNGVVPSAAVIQLNNNTTVQALDITGGKYGILGGDLHGLLVADNRVSGASNSGIFVRSVSDGCTIRGNTSSGNGWDGLGFFSVAGGSVTDNRANGNGDYGFYVEEEMSGGSISGNTASNNRTGLEFAVVSGGTVSGNTVSGSTTYGLQIEELSGGTVSGNTASGNSRCGLLIRDMSGGTVSDNTMSNIARDGLVIYELSGGTVSGNMASGNGWDGFTIDPFDGGTFNNNVATDNGGAGYNVIGTGGTATGNTGSGNASNNVYP